MDDLIARFQPGFARDRGQRVVQAAQLVHQAELLRLRTGPDPSAGNRRHLLDLEFPRTCDQFKKPIVNIVHEALHPLLLARRPTAVNRHGTRRFIQRHALHLDADFFQERPEAQLQREHADGAGERFRFGIDRLAHT